VSLRLLYLILTRLGGWPCSAARPPPRTRSWRVSADLPCADVGYGRGVSDAFVVGDTRGLPHRQMKTSPGVLAASVNSETRRVRPRSARFEPVSRLKGVTHRFLACSFATLAGAAHLAVLDTSWLCQGCSCLHRHPPAQAALSYTSLLRQTSDEGLAPPFETQHLTAQSLRLTDSAALEAKLAEYPGDEDLANGECWL
jgi:hypothetical protein